MAQLLIFHDKKSRWGLRAVMVEPPKERRKPNAPRYCNVAPNKMFQAEQTALIRVLFFKKAAACACCGKLRKRHWTTLAPFYAVNLDDPKNLMAVHEYGPLHQPLTPVCEAHPLREDRETMFQLANALRYFCKITFDQMRRAEAAVKKKEGKA